MREILNWIRINLFSNEIFDDYLIPKMTDPHCESSACAVLKSCGTAVTKSIVIASLAVLTLTGCNTTKTQMKQYDQWDAWVGCYSDLNSAMSRGIILENGNIGFKHRTNSGMQNKFKSICTRNITGGVLISLRLPPHLK